MTGISKIIMQISFVCYDFTRCNGATKNVRNLTEILGILRLLTAQKMLPVFKTQKI